MKTKHIAIEKNEAGDYMPTSLAYATEAGEMVLGVIQQTGESIDLDAAEAAAKKHFGGRAVLRGEGDDIDDGCQWLVIEG